MPIRLIVSVFVSVVAKMPKMLLSERSEAAFLARALAHER